MCFFSFVLINKTDLFLQIELFRPYGNLLVIVRIGNIESQVGAANFVFVVCQSIEMAKAIVHDHENLLKTQKKLMLK
jgi:hypothetical protein